MDRKRGGIGSWIWKQLRSEETSKWRQITIGNKQPNRTLVPSLTLSFFSVFLLDFLIGLFLLDLTATFFGSTDAIYVAITSQIGTISNGVAVIFGIAIALFNVRFKRRTLLLAGALCIPVGIIGCILAPNFLFLQIFFPLDGVGSAVVGIMSLSIAGESLPLSKRAKAIGWIASGASWAQFFGAVLIRYFFPVGDWRSFLLWFALPVSCFALVLAYFAVPSKPVPQQEDSADKDWFKSIKNVFSNTSAICCLFGNFARNAGLVWMTVFAASFLRVSFDISLPDAAAAILAVTLLHAIGGIFGGQVVERIGRKRISVISFAVAGVLIAGVVLVPNVWISIALLLASSLGVGVGMAGSINMTIEQVPENKGTLMSLSNVFVMLGTMTGIAIGGAVLAITSNFQTTGVIFVGLFLLTAGIFLFSTKDPCFKSQMPSPL